MLNRAPRRPLRWLLGCSLAAGCTLPPAPIIRPGAHPLGQSWTYQVSDLQGNVVGQIVSRVVAADGNTITQETTETLNGTSTTSRATATFQADGSVLVDDGQGKISPLPSVRQRLFPGATWDNPDGTKVTVEGQEAVTVPAGTYVAYRMRQTKGSTTVTDWFYPNVGLIKETNDQTLVVLMTTTAGTAPSPTPSPSAAGPFSPGVITSG